MLPMLRIAVITGLALMNLPLVASADDSAAHTDARKQWHSDIAKGYQALAQGAVRLNDAANKYCTQPGPVAKEALRESWRTAFMAWQRVRFVDFGPIATENRAWQFQFWPDRKNLIARKAGLLLKTEKRPSETAIAEAGVAVQGFPIVEYLLYDQNLGDDALPADQTCALLTAVTAHIASTSEQLHLDWMAFAQPYVQSAEFSDTTIRAAMTALEILQERRVAGPMGLGGNGWRSVYGADAWRSRSSLATVEHSIEGLHVYFYPAFAALLEAQGEAGLAEQIGEQFDILLGVFDSLQGPLERLLGDDSGFAQLQRLYIELSQLTQRVNGKAATTLGVIRGFNASDGD